MGFLAAYTNTTSREDALSQLLNLKMKGTVLRFTFAPILSYFIVCAFLLYVVVRTTRTQMLALFAYVLAYTFCWSIDHLINAALRYSYPSSSPVDPFYLRDPVTMTVTQTQ